MSTVSPASAQIGAHRVYWVALLCYIVATFTYRWALQPDPTEAYFARVGGTLFSRTYLPDSSLYERVYDGSEVTVADVVDDMFTGETRQNVLGISALAFLFRRAGLERVYANVVLVGLTGLFLVRICAFYGASATAPLVVLFLNPSTVYYSQTITKEILTLFSSALFVLVIVKTRGAWRAVGALVAALLTLAFRMETVLPMLIALSVSRMSFLTKRRAWLGAFVGLSLILPLLYRWGIMATGSADLYRLDAPSATGLAKYVDMGLQRIPLAGLVFLPVRAFQNATEPFPHGGFEEIEYGASAINVYRIVLMGTVVLCWFFTCEFVRVLWRMVVKRQRGPEHLDTIVLYAGLFWLMVAANAFVHTRYVSNILPVFALVATINRASRDIAPKDHAEPSAAAAQRWSTMPSWAAWGALMVAWGVLCLFQF